MKILVPNFALDWDNEYEKLFMAVMYGVATEGGFNVQYSIYPDDARMILQETNPKRRVFFTNDYQHKHFTFGSVFDADWFFAWTRVPEVSLYEFTDEKAVLILTHIFKVIKEEPLLSIWSGPKKWKGWNRLGQEERKVYQPVKEYKPKPEAQPVGRPKRKVDDDTILDMINDRKKGISYQKISDKYNIGYGTTFTLLKNLNY